MLQRFVISKPKENSNYFFSGTITWRDISFHVDTSISKGYFGNTHQIVIVYNNTIFKFSFTKWKYTGGGTGKSPIIYSGNYRLQIQANLNCLEFKEKLNDEVYNDYPPTCSNFVISSARGYYETNINKEERVNE